MSERFVVFDVETPNAANDRMSAIGLCVVEDGAVTEEYDTLVNPETRFHPFNVALTGITPEMAAEAPAFPELWETALRPLMERGLLVAHNAPFDMSVLGKCLRDYGIVWRPRVRYACTCQMSRRALPELPNHRLDTLCGYLDIELDHHQAASDSRACAQILLHCLGTGLPLRRFIRTYDMARLRTVTPDA